MVLEPSDTTPVSTLTPVLSRPNPGTPTPPCCYTE